MLKALRELPKSSVRERRERGTTGAERQRAMAIEPLLSKAQNMWKRDRTHR